MLNRIKNNTKAKTAAFAGSLLLLLALASTTFLPTPAHALECAAVETSVIECESGTAGGEQTSGIWSLLLIVLNVLTAGVGVMAVGGFIYAAVLWTTAEDKADQLNQAKGVILNTCIGLISFGLMYSLLQFLVPGGVFNSIAAPKVSVDKQRDVNPGMEDCECEDTSGGGTGSGSGSGSGGASGGTSVSTADIKTVKNLRDAAASNKFLKPGVLYRSGQLSNLNEANATKLSKLLGSGGTIIDMRTNEQEAIAHDVPVSGSKNTHIPTPGVHDTTPMVNDPKRYNQLAKVLKKAANAKGSVLIHCVAGKDRTGWTIAMIMYVNGAGDKAVMQEYLLSNQAKNNGVVEAEWLTNGVNAARDKHKTIVGYLKAIGLTDGDINNLKKKFGK